MEFFQYASCVDDQPDNCSEADAVSLFSMIQVKNFGKILQYFMEIVVSLNFAVVLTET